MKYSAKYLIVFIFTFLIGLSVLVIWHSMSLNFNQQGRKRIVDFSETNSQKTESESDDVKKQLSIEDYWENAEEFSYKDYKITNICLGKDVDFLHCQLRLVKGDKVLQEFESNGRHSLNYGFFNFLGEKDKQLVLYNVEGGTCSTHTYLIYDLKSVPRLIYDSRKINKQRDYINFDLTPIDIDKDGIYEFTRSVHTFDYFYGSHIDSIYPTAIFEYDPNTGKYEFANSKFPFYILEKTRNEISWLKQNNQGETFGERFILRKRLLNLIYAGQREEGWRLFEEEYNFEDKQEYKQDLIKELDQCPVYKAIYRVNCSGKSFELETVYDELRDAKNIKLTKNKKVEKIIKLPNQSEFNGFALNWVKKTQKGFEISLDYGSRFYYAKRFNFVCRKGKFFLNEIKVESFDKHNPEKWDSKTVKINPNMPLEKFLIKDYIN